MVCEGGNQNPHPPGEHLFGLPKITRRIRIARIHIVPAACHLQRRRKPSAIYQEAPAPRHVLIGVLAKDDDALIVPQADANALDGEFDHEARALPCRTIRV